MPNVSLGRGSRWASLSIERDPRARLGLLDLVAAQDEHFAAEVGGDDRRRSAGRAVVSQRQIRRARAAVEDRAPRARERPLCVVKVRQDRSMFKLSKWLRKSYRRAIERNIRRTRRADLSSLGSAGSRSGKARSPDLERVVSTSLEMVIRVTHRSAWLCEPARTHHHLRRGRRIAIVVDPPGWRQGDQVAVTRRRGSSIYERKGRERLSVARAECSGLPDRQCRGVCDSWAHAHCL